MSTVYEDGRIKATIECKDPNVDPKVFERCASSLMQHLSCHIGTYKEEEVFKAISSMKSDFMMQVLRYLIGVKQANGEDVPGKVMDTATGGLKYEWEDPEEEDEL